MHLQQPFSKVNIQNPIPPNNQKWFLGCECCVSRNASKRRLFPRAPATGSSRCVFTHTLNCTFIFITIRDSQRGVAATEWGVTAAAWSVRWSHPDRTDASCCCWRSRSWFSPSTSDTNTVSSFHSFPSKHHGRLKVEREKIISERIWSLGSGGRGRAAMCWPGQKKIVLMMPFLCFKMLTSTWKMQTVDFF